MLLSLKCTVLSFRGPCISMLGIARRRMIRPIVLLWHQLSFAALRCLSELVIKSLLFYQNTIHGWNGKFLERLFQTLSGTARCGKSV
jgi:hypothetical protein